MTEPSDRSASASRENPLSHDPVLFDMYIDALDGALRRPEIRQACDEFSLSPAAVRMRMMRNAAQVLSAAPREFDAYQQAVAQQLVAVGTSPGQVTHGPTLESGNVVLLMARWATVAGALIVVAGGVTSVMWAPMAALAEAGATLLVVAALIWAVPRFFMGNVYFQSLGFSRGSGIDLDIVRSRLMVAISGTELVAQVRTFVNAARQDRFGQQYAVAGAPGLSEVYDSANQVPTRVAAELHELLDRFDGASIGVAGPRGSGKSALVRHYCDEIPDDKGYEDTELDLFDLSWHLGADLPKRRETDLRCFVAAPVEYLARDFVLHLFATFCRAVIGRYGARRRHFPRLIVAAFWVRRAVLLLLALVWRAALCGAAVLALLHWKHTIARSLSVPVTWVEYTALVVICLGALDFARSAAITIMRWARQVRGKDEHALAMDARQHLSRVRYLQTYTAGWSGTLQLPWGNASGQYSRAVAQAEQPYSYPEIVEEFRNFARVGGGCGAATTIASSSASTSWTRSDPPSKPSISSMR